MITFMFKTPLEFFLMRGIVGALFSFENDNLLPSLSGWGRDLRGTKFLFSEGRICPCPMGRRASTPLLVILIENDQSRAKSTMFSDGRNSAKKSCLSILPVLQIAWSNTVEFVYQLKHFPSHWRVNKFKFDHLLDARKKYTHLGPGKRGLHRDLTLVFMPP